LRLGPLGHVHLGAAVDRVEHSKLCLFNRRDGIVDRETRFPLEPVGATFGMLRLERFMD